MATTTNYGWTTPDDTALVKDGASAIRSLGTSVDTTTKNLNPSTTLGDIEYRSSTANTNTRLGIGSTGNVLTVAGGVPTWAAPAGGGSNYSLLNAGGTALTGAATITVSGISGYEKFMVLVAAASATASGGFFIRINGDTGANYIYQGAQISAPSAYATSIVGRQGSITGDGFYFAEMSTNAGSSAAGGIKIDGGTKTGGKSVVILGAANASTGSAQSGLMMGGIYAGSAAITSISVYSNGGNFDAGTVYVYASA